MKFDVRPARPDEAGILADNNSSMAVETEGKALDAAVIGAGVVAVLNDKTKARYWVAVADEQIVGQIMVTYEWSDWRNGNIWWIQSVYVCPDARRNGVFSALYRHVESLASEDPDAIGLRLYVEKNNRRAQQTYETLGMHTTHYLVMEAMLGGDEQC